MWRKEGLSILNFKLRINNKGQRDERTERFHRSERRPGREPEGGGLEQLVSLAYHLVLMHHLLPGWRLQEIEAAILAATALAAHRRNDILHRIDENRIARKLLYPTDEISL